MCFRLPENVTMEEGALVEPLCVGLHACRQGNVKLGDSVVILGAGCIGLAALMSAKAMGASNVVVVDLYEKRLEFAKDMGANYVINAAKEDVFDQCRKIFGSRGADIVIETAGSPKTIYQTSILAKQGGTVVLVGIAVNNDLTYNFGQVMSKELTVKSVFRYRNLYPVAIAAIADGSIDVKKMVTHRFPFHDAKKAFDTVISDANNVVKAVIEL